MKGLYDWGDAAANQDAKHAASFQRNHGAILDVLLRHVFSELPRGSRVLEIGSGTGEHVQLWARTLPELVFLPTEMTAEGKASVTAHCRGLPNVLPVSEVDLLANGDSQHERVDCVVAVNVFHVVAETAVQRFAAVCAGARVVAVYGAFTRNGAFNAPSNESFDAMLRKTNPAFGLRDVDTQLVPAMAAHGLALTAVHEMPANNYVLVFRAQ